MPAITKIREHVRLSACVENDEVSLPEPADCYARIVKVKPIPGGRLQVKFRKNLTSGNVCKADIKGDPLVERRRVPVTDADFAILAEMKEQEARMRCQRHGMRPDDLTETGQPKWTLFTDEAMLERDRRATAKRQEEAAARRAEVEKLMPIGVDEMMESYAALGITSGPGLDIVRRMLESSPAYGSVAIASVFEAGGILKRVG